MYKTVEYTIYLKNIELFIIYLFIKTTNAVYN